MPLLAILISSCGLVLDLEPSEQKRLVDGGTDDASVGTDGDAAPSLDGTSCDDVHAGALLCDGFEDLPEFARWIEPIGGVAYTSEPRYRGNTALSATIQPDPRIATLRAQPLPDVTAGEIFVRAYLLLPSSSPAEDMSILRVEEGAHPWGHAEVRIEFGELVLKSAPDQTLARDVIGSAGAMPVDVWTCVELRVRVSDTDGEVELSVDGVSAVLSGLRDTRPAMPYLGFYAGIYITDGALQTTPSELFVDEVVVALAPIGCDP